MSDDNELERESLTQYHRSRARTRTALIGVLISVVVGVVFNQASSGDGLAYNAHIAAYYVGLVCLVLAFRASWQMGEARGFYRGKFGRLP